ncbi:hypothetical protein [Pseudalkalibacillus sp. R45]
MSLHYVPVAQHGRVCFVSDDNSVPIEPHLVKHSEIGTTKNECAS